MRIEPISSYQYIEPISFLELPSARPILPSSSKIETAYEQTQEQKKEALLRWAQFQANVQNEIKIPSFPRGS
jgi:hypothetical protein